MSQNKELIDISSVAHISWDKLDNAERALQEVYKKHKMGWIIEYGGRQPLFRNAVVQSKFQFMICNHYVANKMLEYIRHWPQEKKNIS